MISGIDLQLQTLDLNAIKEQAGVEEKVQAPENLKRLIQSQKQGSPPGLEASPRSKKKGGIDPIENPLQDLPNKMHENFNVDSPMERRRRSFESVFSYNQEV